MASDLAACNCASRSSMRVERHAARFRLHGTSQEYRVRICPHRHGRHCKGLAQEGYHGRRAQRAPQNRQGPPRSFSPNCSACPSPHLRMARHYYHQAALNQWRRLPETDRRQTEIAAMLQTDAVSYVHVNRPYRLYGLVCRKSRVEALTVLEEVLGCGRELSFLCRPGVQRDLPARRAGNDWLKSLPQHTLGGLSYSTKCQRSRHVDEEVCV